MNTFLTTHRAAPEKITLPSGAVEVPKFSRRFRSWPGKPVDDTYGGKALIDCNGSLAFAELAIIPVLKEHGFDGAVWVDSYRRRFRDAMPPAVRALPPPAQAVYDQIAAISGGRGGCWDVLALERGGSDLRGMQAEGERPHDRQPEEVAGIRPQDRDSP